MGPLFATRRCNRWDDSHGVDYGTAALVLLLACTNVTMLFLSRSIKRRGEIAVRLALGAGRARLMRMLALESFLTAAAAGLLSIYLATRFPRSSSESRSPGQTRHRSYSLTGRSLAILPPSC